ncbi:hypothetical protein [Methylibium sp. Root1272]|uniref:hypothetical protein n=1 Tax=Methylibium sp. Root1272 TaxID=1736441 RepID=UPI0006F38FE1|nr:hypothetical protein [Methylibium sp. Root1272]KQW76594.1 hypothetical protein ASC67_02780 [Methylibium sp. Root1272]
MAAESIGRCTCPLCRSDRARLSLAKSGLPVLTCNGCNIQLFARSDRSDELVRALIVHEAPPPPADDPPAPPAPIATAPQPAPATRAPMGWGVLGHA